MRNALRKRYGHGGDGGHVQSLMFPMSKFTLQSAKSWAERHGWRTGDVDFSPDMEFIHLRQEDPRHFVRIRTVHMGGSGVQARVGWRV
jgi:hypothetical protein